MAGKPGLFLNLIGIGIGISGKTWFLSRFAFSVCTFEDDVVCFSELL
jgi:hypothetical protein